MSFREFITSSGKKVLAGKNAEQNDELVKQFLGKENKIMHTSAPGSPFCVFEELKPGKKDLEETAIFCASKSQDWRDHKHDVLMHIFSGKETYKEKGMKEGMFGVRKMKSIKVKKKDILEFIDKAKKENNS
jgi:predicted ribosome quality control (RQC) complex YloA/Tae2 family protein